MYKPLKSVMEICKLLLVTLFVKLIRLLPLHCSLLQNAKILKNISKNVFLICTVVCDVI
jgi:hypothetical protein